MQNIPAISIFFRSLTNHTESSFPGMEISYNIFGILSSITWKEFHGKRSTFHQNKVTKQTMTFVDAIEFFLQLQKQKFSKSFF